MAEIEWTEVEFPTQEVEQHSTKDVVALRQSLNENHLPTLHGFGDDSEIIAWDSANKHIYAVSKLNGTGQRWTYTDMDEYRRHSREVLEFFGML